MRRGIWSCSSCAVLLLCAVLGREVGASHAKRRDRDTIHRLEKAHVTAAPGKRDADLCPADYNLCPASLNGGCCPQRYGCETDSCYATTAGYASACGQVGYFACGADVGGGCCPEGYICGANDCTAPAGVSNTYTVCPAGSYLCPASLNYGCCMSGMGCALNACYATTPTTYTYTQTVTTVNSASRTVTTTQTATTIATPTAPTGLPTGDTASGIPKFIPTAVAKVAATSSATSSSGGLTNGEIGGIIAGAVVLLIAVVAAAFFIIRRLNRVAAAVESKRGTSTSGRPKPPPALAGPYARFKPTTSEVDAMSYDPLMIASGPASPPPPSQAAGGTRGRSNSEMSSQQQTPYGAVPTSGSSDLRNGSLDSGPGGYFDIPGRVQNFPGRHSLSTAVRTSLDSQSTQQQQMQQVQFPYGRHGRNASEFSNPSSDDGHGHGSGTHTPLIIAELDTAGGFVPELPATAGPRRVSNGDLLAPDPSRPPLSHQRRRSEGHVRGRSDSPAGSAAQLDAVNESVEVMHGYYGPSDRQVGQTAVGLEGQGREAPPSLGFQP